MARGKRRGGRQRQTQRQQQQQQQQQQRQRGVTNNNTALEHFMELINKAQVPFDFLEAVVAAPSVWEDCRWLAFSNYYKLLGGILGTPLEEISGVMRVLRDEMTTMPSEKDHTTLHDRFVDNEDEPILFRAHASFLLAVWSFRDTKNDDASVAIQRCLSLIQQGLSSSEGQRPMENHFGPTPAETTVQELLDRLQEDCKTLMGWIKKGLTGQTRSILKHLPMHCSPPKINSDLINHIASLPEKDVVWSVRAPFFADFEDYERCNGLFDDYCFSPVFQFDLERFESGSEDSKKIFRLVSLVVCSGSETRTKMLLSVFSSACTHLRYRPRDVLFDTLEDANQQQTTQFLELMGIDKKCVGVLDARAQKLADLNFPELVSKKLSDKMKKKMPHVADLFEGIFCGSCGALGQTLQQCSCGKAYYCNTTCQRAKWKEHKEEHDEIIAKMEKKNDA